MPILKLRFEAQGEVLVLLVHLKDDGLPAWPATDHRVGVGKVPGLLKAGFRLRRSQDVDPAVGFLLRVVQVWTCSAGV